MKWLALALVSFPLLLNAHPLAPALLQLEETAPERFDVLWRTSATRAQRVDVEPVLPRHCRAQTPAAVALEGGEALVRRWSVACAGGLSGSVIQVRGLEHSRINVIVRVASRDGAVRQALLEPARPSLQIKSSDPVFGAYLRLGTAHLLGGYDHLLFLLGLVLVLRRARPLIAAVTAFTAGHSITLALATLGVLNVSPAWTELGIALSLVLLAAEAARGRERPGAFARLGWSAALAFGLLHGLGFAGALSDVGLPRGEIPLALLAFNLGIELAQLAVLLVVGAGVLLARRWPPGRIAYRRLSLAPAYLVGTLGAYWCCQRAADLMTGA